MNTHVLSKSTFVRGCQCTKSLFLNKFYSALRDPASESKKAIFRKGTEVGKLARNLFPGGVNVAPLLLSEYDKSVVLTQELISKNQPVIYEAAFQYEGVLAAVDILTCDNNSWNAYEVKSSTVVKDEYLWDAALQYYLMQKSGLVLNDIFIVHINNKYVRKGEIDVKQLFTIESVKDKVWNLQQKVIEKIEQFKIVLSQGEIPKIDIGLQCNDPHPCDFLGHCWSGIPEPSVFNISNISGKAFDLISRSIVTFGDIPKEENLTKRQWLQVRSHLDQSNYIEEANVQKFLKSIRYPLYFMDFETINLAIPPFENSRPYHQIPFQYSVHYKEYKEAQSEHHEFLADAKGDPRIAFIENLLSVTQKPGIILTYHKGFETARLKELAREFPTYTNDIEERLSRIADLEVPFQKRMYYTSDMNGRSSIKEVLPALVPDMSYHSLEIQEGGGASLAFEELLFNRSPDAAKLRAALKEYCKTDTLAMVKILEVLEKI